MKKYLFSALAMGLLLTSCQSDEPFAPGEGGEKQVTFTLNVPGELGTRADFGANKSGVSGVSNEGTANIKYTLVLKANGDTKILDNDDATINGKTATFSPTVVLGREYKITAYASLGDAWDGENAIDITKHFNDETKDAYFYTTTYNFAEGDLQPLALKRPFGKLRLLATDYKLDNSGVLNTAVKNVKITYNDAQAAEFDVFNSVFEFSGNFVNADAQTFGYYGAEEDGAMPIFADYVPANPGDNMVDFTVEVTYTNDETYSRTFNDIPVKRNALTTLKGNFFTAGAEITVKVEDAFENEPINKSFVSTASQLQDAINNAPSGETTEIILGNDIELTEPLVFGLPPVNPAPAQTRSEEATAGNFILDLNGKDISYPNGYAIENYSAELTISGNGRLGSDGLGGIRSHGGKIVINDGTFTGSSDWNKGTYQHILKAVNTEVEINGGTFDATIGGMTNAMINVSENSVVTINGGTFKNVDGEIPQFAPYMFTYEKNGKLIIDGGDFYGGWRFNGDTATTEINGGDFTVSYDGQSFHATSTHKLTIKGGRFSLENGGKLNPTNYVADGYVVAQEGELYNVVPAVAKVGSKGYATIDDAIAGWTHNTTLTLLSDVTLNDVVTLKSTEYHVLDLGTYTMTAAKGKDAISITAEGRSSASYALDIKADATNPGGITATSKAVVKTTGKSGVKDRPIIRFYNGVFNASNIISHSGSNGTNCPQFQFHGGVYNCSLSANRALIQIYGGTFNGRFYISVDSSAYALISGGKFKYLDNLYGSALNSDKFTIGSSKGNFDRGVYVDDEGYIVVGGSVITDFGDKFAAKATNVSKAGSYLPYSSAAANGLYYTNADMAIAKHGAANVVLK